MNNLLVGVLGIIGVSLLFMLFHGERAMILNKAKRLVKAQGINTISIETIGIGNGVHGMHTFRVSYRDSDGNLQTRHFGTRPASNKLTWLDNEVVEGKAAKLAPLPPMSSKEQIIDELSAENAKLRAEIAQMRGQ